MSVTGAFRHLNERAARFGPEALSLPGVFTIRSLRQSQIFNSLHIGDSRAEWESGGQNDEPITSQRDQKIGRRWRICGIHPRTDD